MFSTKLVNTPVPTTAPRPAGADCAWVDVRPAHSAHKRNTAPRMLFANRAMSFALLFDCDPSGRNVDPLLDAPAFSSLHVKVFVVAAVVSQIGKPMHAFRRWRQPQAGVAEKIGPFVDASGGVVRFVFVGAVEVLVMAVI